MDRSHATIDAHYGRPELGAAILAGLRAAGKDPDRPTLEDLAPVDHFHSRGLAATLDLVRLADLPRGASVLDVGGGIGGAARLLARDFGLSVTVLDFTEAYCQVGADLTRRTGLDRLVTFRHGDATRMPFDAATFDAVWTQHSSMNIEDKERLYREIRRVLRPGGRLALHEIMGGPSGQPVLFPVPWAREPALSFLRPAGDVRRLLGDVGFTEITWRDESQIALPWFRERAAAVRAGAGPPPLGLHLLLGADFPTMLGNQVRNIEEGRIAVVQAVLRS